MKNKKAIDDGLDELLRHVVDLRDVFKSNAATTLYNGLCELNRMTDKLAVMVYQNMGGLISPHSVEVKTTPVVAKTKVLSNEPRRCEWCGEVPCRYGDCDK